MKNPMLAASEGQIRVAKSGGVLQVNGVTPGVASKIASDLRQTQSVSAMQSVA